MKPDDMPATTYAIAAPPEARAARFLLKLLQRLRIGRLDLIGPDGVPRTFSSGFTGPHAMLRLHDWEVCADIVRSGDIGFAEAFMAGRWDAPDLTALLELAAANHASLERAIYGRWWGGLAYRLRHLLRGNRRSQAKRNIHAHYDLGNDFYRLWLDDTMTYSAALFEGQAKRPLEQAQMAKYERICRLLGLNAEHRVLEIGCGWGGFAEYAVRTRGCRVHGITLSTEQLAHAQHRIALQGIGDRATFELIDYRDVRGQYDHVVSIEMFEAVGEHYWPIYFRKVRETLKRGGRAVIQTIVIANELFTRYRNGTDFIQQYVFPGGMLPSEDIFRDRAFQQGLVVGQATAFGFDYAETLRRWRHRFNGCVPELQGKGFDDRFVRLWNFYLAYCEAGFRARTIDVLQVELKRV
jgi:cyclopropane-fatty-acyl-phospholipid synthase